MASVTSETPLEGFTQTIASQGLIGLYLGFVLVVGKFLRVYVSGLVPKIIYENLPDGGDEILQMVRDIFNARADRDLVMEEALWRELLELYRSPQRLQEITKIKRR